MAIFDPSELTVKAATKLLVDLSDDELSAVYNSELEAKGRRSLLDAISAARDGLREDIAEEVLEPKVAVKAARNFTNAQSYIRSRGK